MLHTDTIYIVTKFTSFLFKGVILVGSRVVASAPHIATLHRQIPCISQHSCIHTQNHHMAAHTHTKWLQTLYAYTTGPTAAHYLPALAFIPTTSPLSYSLVSAPRSHHQSYNSASQLPHLQYAKCNIFSSQLISPNLTHVYMISTSSPTGRPLRRFSCTSSLFSFLHIRTRAKIYHNLSLAQLFPFTVNNALVM